MTEQQRDERAAPTASSHAAGGARRTRSLREALASLLAAVLLPLLAAGSLFLVQQWIQQRHAVSSALHEQARTLERAVDRELALDQAVLGALAMSREIDAGDWRAFHAAAEQAARVRPGSWFVLYDRTGRNVVNTSVPFGTPLPNFRDLRTARPDVEWEGRKLPLPGAWLFAPFETMRPSFSGVFYGPVKRRPVVASTVPVVRGGQARYVLALAYAAEFFVSVLQSDRAPDVVAGMWDERGRLIARSRHSERFVGLPGPSPFRGGSASLPAEGEGEAPNAEAIPFVYAYRRSAVADYVVGAGMPKAAVLAPAWRALALWLAVLACAGALGSLVAFRLWRRVGTPLLALAHQARSPAGLEGQVEPTGIEEVDALGSALRARAEAERARRDAESHYRALAENAPELIARFDRQLRHTYLNEYGAKVYGLPVAEVIGRSNEELGTPAEEVAVWRRHFEEVLATGEQRSLELEFVSPTFGVRWFASLFVPEKDARGEIVSVLAITRDVTDSKRAEEALRSANEKLREADRRKDEFLGMLSHELRNPLAPIRNALYILDRAPPDGPQARRAKDIASRQVAHLTRLVDDLLDVTRIARGKVELRHEDLDLAALAGRAAEDYRPLMHERGVELEVNLPPEPVVVNGDPARVTQVLGNLLGNAAKFTPAGGRVQLALGREQGWALVQVRDTGPGIPDDLLPVIFDPFTQAKQTLARSEGGLGLGLALVKGLVEMHGGSVEARSQGAGQGAQFTLRLPLAAPHLAERPSPVAPGRPTSARHVLVVDDNADAAGSLAELVSLFGHDVEVAYDGPSALAKVRQHRPDVVLCDLGLPGMTGYEVAQALRAQDGGSLRLVAVSGYAQAEDVERATAAGFDAHLAKPPDPEKIERLLA